MSTGDSRTWHTSTSLTSITPLLLTIYLYSESKWWYQVFRNITLTSRNVSTTALVDVEVLCVEGKDSSGIFDMTCSLLNSIHFLKLVLEITFKGGVGHVPHFPQGTGYNWGVWESRHNQPLSHQISPHGLAPPPGVLTQAGPPSAFVTHCSQLYCDRLHFTWPHWDIWSSSGCHLFLREGDRSQNWDQ